MNAEAEATQKPAEPSSARLVLTLGMAGLLAGLLLMGVFKATEPRITANKQKALQRAVLKVVPGSNDLQPLVYRDGKLVAAPGAEGSGVIYGAYDNKTGDFKGYAIPGNAPGYADVIELIYGYDPTKKVVIGMEVLDCKETPGIGDKIRSDPGFHANFEALAVTPDVKAVPHGTKKSPNQIDAISGATVSSKAVAKAIRTADKTWLDKLPPPGSEPALEKEAAAPAPAAAKGGDK